MLLFSFEILVVYFFVAIIIIIIPDILFISWFWFMLFVCVCLVTANPALNLIDLFNVQEFYIKSQTSIWWNNSWMSSWTVCKVWWADQSGAFTNWHLYKIQNQMSIMLSGLPLIPFSNKTKAAEFYLCNAFIPSSDYFTSADNKFEWFATSSGRIEYGAIVQCTSVVDNNGLASFWIMAS